MWKTIDNDVMEASNISITINECLTITSKCLFIETLMNQEVIQNMVKNVKLSTITLPRFSGAALEEDTSL